MPLPTRPITPTLDDFERANETPLDFAGKWGPLAPEWPECYLRDHSFDCSIGAAQAEPGESFGASMWRHQSFDADQEIHCELTGSSTCWVQAQLGEGYRLFLRGQQLDDNATYDAYQLILHNETGDDTARITKYINGTSTQIGATVSLGVGGLFTYKYILFRAEGTTISAYGSDDEWATSNLIISRTDSSISGGGYIGIGFQVNTTSFMPQIDNVGGGNLVRKWIPQSMRTWGKKG